MLEGEVGVFKVPIGKFPKNSVVRHKSPGYVQHHLLQTALWLWFGKHRCRPSPEIHRHETSLSFSPTLSWRFTCSDFFERTSFKVPHTPLSQPFILFSSFFITYNARFSNSWVYWFISIFSDECIRRKKFSLVCYELPGLFMKWLRIQLLNWNERQIQGQPSDGMDSEKRLRQASGVEKNSRQFLASIHFEPQIPSHPKLPKVGYRKDVLLNSIQSSMIITGSLAARLNWWSWNGRNGGTSSI
jgi:hypothetical protein